MMKERDEKIKYQRRNKRAEPKGACRDLLKTPGSFLKLRTSRQGVALSRGSSLRPQQHPTPPPPPPLKQTASCGTLREKSCIIHHNIVAFFIRGPTDVVSTASLQAGPASQLGATCATGKASLNYPEKNRN